MATSHLFAALALMQVMPPALPQSGPALVTFQPGEVRCGGRVERPILADPPLPLALDYSPPAALADGVASLRFRIAADGRTLGIGGAQPVPGGGLQSSDLGPAVASWRFAPGAERRDCEVQFTRRQTPVADAPIEDLRRVMILNRPSMRFAQAAAPRMQPADSTCRRPQLRAMHYPDFPAIPQPLGTESYTLMGFDVDAAGRPTGVHVAGSSGNAALDRAGMAAIRQARFGPQALHGCTYPYWRRNTTPLAAPPAPEAESLRPAGSECRTADITWRSLPPTGFPQAYRRRNIEGWAMVGFDVAPWGATGNVRVLASEPAVEFGQQALAIVAAARAQDSTAGRTGCIHRILFRIDPNAAQESITAGNDGRVP